jgi:hypothetical protein
MPDSRRAPLDEALPLGSYGFLVLELAFKDERDLPGLVRYRLESVLPRGVDGLRYCFRRVGRRGRLLVTLVKEPAPATFDPARTALPFALRLPDGKTGDIVWVSRNANFLARYEDGLLASVEVAAGGERAVAGRGADEDSSAAVGARAERRDAPSPGASAQQPIGRDDLAWKIAAAALGIALATQLALTAVQAVAAREARLAALGDQIAVLSTSASADPGQAAAAPDTGLQTLADETQKSVSRRWKAGYYLEAWSMKAGVLRLEGWGPEALSLLSALRVDPRLARLELASRKDEEGYEAFAFEGKVGDD